MSKYKLEFRHRPNFENSISNKHKEFLENISMLDSPWNLKEIGPLDDIGSELVLVKVLDKALVKGVKGRIQYSFRNEKYLTDTANHDDIIIIEFNSSKISFNDTFMQVFFNYIESFDCYRATIHEVAITRSDFPHIIDEYNNTHKDVNGRDGIYRINAINFYDNELCQRAFNLTTDQVVDRLKDEVESVYKTARGVVIIYSSQLLSQDDMLAIDSKIRSLLKI